MDPFQLIGHETAVKESDDPIEAWGQDLLDRAPLIEVLAAKLLIAKKAIVVLDGKFGAGKTSVLNLLRARLGKAAVVVPFSAWLPVSEHSLIESLLSDIAVESRKQFIVPGLGRNTRRTSCAAAGLGTGRLGAYSGINLKFRPYPRSISGMACRQ